MKGLLLLFAIGAGVLLLVLGLRLWTHQKARKMEGRRLPSPWSDRLPSPVLLFLTTPWCSVCKAQRPLVEALSRRLPVREIDLSTSPNLAQALGIFATPTYLWVEEGQVRRVWIGAQSLQTFQDLTGGRA